MALQARIDLPLDLEHRRALDLAAAQRGRKAELALGVLHDTGHGIFGEGGGLLEQVVGLALHAKARSLHLVAEHLAEGVGLHLAAALAPSQPPGGEAQGPGPDRGPARIAVHPGDDLGQADGAGLHAGGEGRGGRGGGHGQRLGGDRRHGQQQRSHRSKDKLGHNRPAVLCEANRKPAETCAGRASPHDRAD
ncbi:MAG: hypothetical protein B7Y99_03905 [Caulobacterales bacterium 32-69-10]|nr:MAG: hypothetical protein B7Y99_03905 [Caulobacterales bacterium 32-69-10]